MLLVVILLWASLHLFPKPEPLSDGPLITTLGTRVNQTSVGNWTVHITSGSYKASSVRFTVLNHTTGVETVNKVVSRITPVQNDPDAVYCDSNANSRLDTGDTIVLKASSGHITGGNRVTFLQGQDVIGTIRELPVIVG